MVGHLKSFNPQTEVRSSIAIVQENRRTRCHLFTIASRTRTAAILGYLNTTSLEEQRETLIFLFTPCFAFFASLVRSVSVPSSLVPITILPRTRHQFLSLQAHNYLILTGGWRTRLVRYDYFASIIGLCFLLRLCQLSCPELDYRYIFATAQLSDLDWRILCLRYDPSGVRLCPT